VVNDSIPIHKAQLPSRELISNYLEKIDLSRIYSNFGPLNKEFEARIANHLGLDPSCVVSACNATLALEGAIETSPTSPKTLWEAPSWTFTASLSALVRTGRRVKFRDVDHEWFVSSSQAAKALMFVLPFGDSLRTDFSAQKLECVVIDAAASFDAVESVDLPIATPTSGVLSFHATKSLQAGEGGVFFTNDPDWAKRFRLWSSFGLNLERQSEVIGTNAKMSEYSAAVALASLDMWNLNKPRWHSQINRAKSLSNGVGLATNPAMFRSYIAPYWIVQLDSASESQRLESMMNAEAIETRHWWASGCHTMPAFRLIERDDLSNTEMVSNTTLGLPLSIDQDEKAWSRIQSVLAQFRS